MITVMHIIAIISYHQKQKYRVSYEQYVYTVNNEQLTKLHHDNLYNHQYKNSIPVVVLILLIVNQTHTTSNSTSSHSTTTSIVISDSVSLVTLNISTAGGTIIMNIRYRNEKRTITIIFTIPLKMKQTGSLLLVLLTVSTAATVTQYGSSDGTRPSNTALLLV